MARAYTHRFIDLTGRRFARLTVLEIDPSCPRRRGHTLRWICQCECGAIKSINGEQLRNGETKSCGCWQRDSFSAARTTHGDSRSGDGRRPMPEYRSWSAMLNRCRNPNATGYYKYGGRGIDVCERWLTYVNFLADMGRRPSLEYSIDRIDNTKGYYPGNCRWATRLEQSNNVRRNTLITHGSVTKTLPEWSRATGISQAALKSRLKMAWPVGQALGFEPRPK